MVYLLADRALYAYYDDEPSPSLEDLRERYAQQTRGVSADGAQQWHNWILRIDATGEPAGFVQATVTAPVAELAWVVGAAYQRTGVATEAATAVRDALLSGATGMRIDILIAHIAPGHAASEALATRLGLTPTPTTVEAEIRWQLG